MLTKTGKPRTSSTNRANDLTNQKPANLKTRRRMPPRQSSKRSKH